MSASVQALLRNRKIEGIDIDCGVYIVDLADHWQVEGEGNDIAGCHTFGADTITELRTTLRTVIPCDCNDCNGIATPIDTTNLDRLEQQLIDLFGED